MKGDCLALLLTIAIGPIIFVLMLCSYSPTFAFAVDRIILRAMFDASHTKNILMCLFALTYTAAFVVSLKRMK